eukprot:6213186-Pleurochrysis_carterae.AAC.2
MSSTILTSVHAQHQHHIRQHSLNPSPCSPPAPGYDMWTEARHRQEWAKTASRRTVAVENDLDADTTQSALPRGTSDEESPLTHWRRGLVGAFQDWGRGSLSNVIKLICMVATYFKVVEVVSAKLADVIVVLMQESVRQL